MTKKPGSGKAAHGAQHPSKVKAAGGSMRTPAKLNGRVAAAKPKAKANENPEDRYRKSLAAKKK